MSGPTATTDEIKITRKRIDEMSSELTKLKKEVKLLLFYLLPKKNFYKCYILSRMSCHLSFKLKVILVE